MPVQSRTIGGRYQLRRRLGSGGSGTVYLAWDIILCKEWAVKVIPRSHRQADEEIAVLTRLSHPRLPRIVDVVRDTGSCFIVMDLAEGETLMTQVRRNGRQPERAVIRWGIQLCGVLVYLASLTPPLIYRDMKPSNIILRPDGEVTLTDLGSAGTISILDAEQSGTPSFAAPEQKGVHGRADARSDIYSLGMTLISLLAGVEEPDASTVKTLTSADPPVSEGLVRVLKIATKARPSRRYQDAADFRDALSACLDGERAGLAVRKRRGFGAIGMAAAGTLLLMAGSACRETLLVEMGSRYAGLLIEASQFEKRSMDQAAACYEEAMALLPARGEAYLQYLDAMVRQGCAQEGILNITARAAAAGGITDQALMYRIGRLYFEGADSMERDFRKAESWLCRVDTKLYPEAAYMAAVCRILYGGGTKDWRKLDGLLAAFLSDSSVYEDPTRRMEARMMISGIYRSQRQGFAEEGISGFTRAAMTLEKARSDQALLDADMTADLQEVLRNLAAIYSIDEGPSSCFHPERAVAIYATLKEEAKTKDERKEYALREAAASQLTGDTAKTDSIYRNLVRRYPDAESYFRFSLWLLDQGRKKEAGVYFRIGRRMRRAVVCPEYAALRKRLSEEEASDQAETEHLNERKTTDPAGPMTKQTNPEHPDNEDTTEKSGEKEAS